MTQPNPTQSKRAWFVYYDVYDVEYYPWAEIVMAPTPEEAVKHLSDYERGKGTCVAVMPADEIQIIAPSDDDARRWLSP
jgi:hypothetical protein